MTAQSEDSSLAKSQQSALPKPAYSFPLLIWAAAAAFFFFQFIARVSLSVSADQIMHDFSIQACAMGVIASMYYWGYTLMQIPVGVILDRVGVRYPLTVAILMCATGCYLFASPESLSGYSFVQDLNIYILPEDPNLKVMSFGRLLIGVGSAFAFLSCVKTASVWFDARHLPIILGWTIFIGPIGGAVGSGAPLAALVTDYGWRSSILLLGAIGLGIAIVAWLFVRDDKSGKGKGATEKELQLSIVESFVVIFKNPQTYCYALYAGLMYIPLSGFADLWGTPYIMKAYNVDKVLAAGSVSFFYIGVAIGGPISAWVISQLQSYKKHLLLGSVFTCILFLVIIYVPLPAYRPMADLFGFKLYLLDTLFLVAGLSASAQFFAFACVCVINPKNVRATATGIQNMAGMISGIVFQPVIGLLLDWSWDGTLEAGKPVYSQQDFFLALSTIPICLALAALVTFTLREVYPQDS